MNSLTLDKAMELYEILGAHIPEVEDSNITVWNFIGKIIDSVNSSDDRTIYTVALELLSGNTLYELQEMSPEERIKLFADSLAQNRILDLKQFCKQSGF